jgi:hypothetical protein
MSQQVDRSLPKTDGEKYRRWIKPLQVVICAEHDAIYKAFRANFPTKVERCERDEPFATKVLGTNYYMRYRRPNGQYVSDPETWL